MATVKYDTSHHSGGTAEARIANRLKNSGCDTADHVAEHGTGPTRTFTNVHSRGQGAAPRHVKLEDKR